MTTILDWCGLTTNFTAPIHANSYRLTILELNWGQSHGVNYCPRVAVSGPDFSWAPLTSKLPVSLVSLGAALLTSLALRAVTLEPVTFLFSFVGRGSTYLLGDIHGEPA